MAYESVNGVNTVKSVKRVKTVGYEEPPTVPLIRANRKGTRSEAHVPGPRRKPKLDPSTSTGVIEVESEATSTASSDDSNGNAL